MLKKLLEYKNDVSLEVPKDRKSCLHQNKNKSASDVAHAWPQQCKRWHLFHRILIIRAISTAIDRNE